MKECAIPCQAASFVADSVEVMAQAHRLDGLVLLSNCDKVTPGMLMAAARLDIPAISLTGGAMASGSIGNEKVGVNNVFEAMGKVYAGKMTPEELKLLENVACPGCGSCNGMFTANTMACLTEALGMSLPGCATALANSAKKTAYRQRNRSANRSTREGKPVALTNLNWRSVRECRCG